MKRVFDVVVAMLTILILSPLIVGILLLIVLLQGWPPFFCQVRPGKGGKPFKLIKFRTMSDAADRTGVSLSDKQRLTRFGRLLRTTSLDELPELWNVLKGDMSVVGPRPLLMEYLPLYTAQQARRHEVLPGITGWAQVNGRNALSWEEKFRLDVWYVDHQSLRLDLKILFLTGWKVFKREGISYSGSATMPTFRGSSKSDRVT